MSTATLPPISEATLQLQIIEVAHLFGYRVAHFRPAKTSKGWRTAVAADGAGFPDLVLVNPIQQRVIWAELKSESGIVSLDQQAWLDALVAAGEEVYTWRPRDFDEAVEILRRLG
jgi:hypothetical protein